MMEITYAGLCDKGLKRAENQDAILMRQGSGAGLYVVADGMGGHSHGEVASGAIVRALGSWWDGFPAKEGGGDFRGMLLSLQETLQEANRTVYRTYNQDTICGSTVVLLFWHKEQYCLIHAGDSRAYLWKERKFLRMTMDDVWENQPGMAERDRRNPFHPDRGKLTNAFGIQEPLRLKIVTDVLEAGTVFLLCSDGLYKFCREKDLKSIIKRAAKKGLLQEELHNMLDLVYQNGANDNVSAVIVRCGAAAPRP